jgi:hypothetical protein
VAFSYASYAGNGSNKNFSVPFPYLLKAHVKVYTGFNILDGTYTSLLVEGTDYTWTSGTQVQTTVAPANGVTLTVLRDTPDSSQLVPWTDGSNLVSNDLNTADLQNLYVVQEQQDRNDAGVVQSLAAQTAANAATTAANTATSTANTALSTSNTALTNANAAVSTANTASTNASAAVSTANTAASNASAAVSTANAASSTANTASTNASNAVTTANAAAATAATALSTANTAATNASAAVSTANTASSNASAAVTTANTASTNASNAVTTANTANTNASAAVTTANTASTNASTALTTANSADNKANQAIAAVSNSINYQLKANVAAIPASPANDTYIEVQDSTGLESFTPLSGIPAGFVGDSGLSVRLRYTTAGTTWNWLNYYANNSETRYLKLAGGTLNGQLKGDDSASASTPGFAFDGDPDTGMGRPGANELALITGGVVRLSFDSSGAAAFSGSVTIPAGSTVTGYLTSATAASTYQTQAGMSSYLTTSSASSTYAPLASPTFTGTVTIPAGASISGYLTSATAASTYQTQAGMNSYLTTSSASSTYAPLASPTFTGTVTIPAGALISDYLTTATASSTYQTQAGMSSYAPLASPTFTGTVTIPAGASISGYLTTSSASSTYAPLASPTFTGTVTIPAGASISGFAALGTAQSFTKAQRGSPVALTDAATVAVDLSLGNFYTLTLGGSRTLGAPTNQTAGQSGVIVITQDGTGSRTLGYNSVWKFPGGTPPVLTTTANAVDVLVYYVESATRITARLLSDVK